MRLGVASMPVPRRRAPLIACMLAAMLAVVSLASWDAARESAAALNDFEAEQAMLGATASAAVAARLAAARGSALTVARELSLSNLTSNAKTAGAPSVRLRFRGAVPAEAAPPGALNLEVPLDEQRFAEVTLPIEDLLGELRWIDQPGRRLLLHRAQTVDFVDIAGQEVRGGPLAAALEAGRTSLRLSRPDSAELGLPLRMAVAGLHTFEAGPLGRWGVAVVSTAERVRDRERWAQQRLVLVLLVAAGLVGAFGGVALMQQRRELEFSREIALAEVREQADERLRRADKLATMGALATGIAHEVSTPLGVILGRAEQLLPRVAEDPRATRAVEAITAQTERIGRVIRAFLDLARGEARTLRVLDAALIARTCVDLVEHRFVKAGVTLTLAAGPETTGAVAMACDPELLEQAVVNLLLNACDASASGGSVTLSVLASEARVAFEVRDHGAGITEEARARAAEPFFTTKPSGKGTGLGLAITSEIVKHHQGTLSIDNAARDQAGDEWHGEGAAAAPAAGAGTRARIELPRVSSAAERVCI